MQRTFLGLGGAALVTIIAMFFLGGADQEFATSSPRAYDLYVEGHSELRAFHYAAAESLLTASVELDTTFAIAHAVLASTYYRLDRRDEANRMLKRARKLTEEIEDDVERAKTELYLTQFDQRSARQDSLLAFIEEREPENLLALSIKAQVLFSHGDPEADAAYLHILSIDPNFATAYNQLGYSAARRGDYDKAIEYLRKYAFVAPDLANPHDSLGEVLMMVGRYDEAAREFKEALRLQPDFHFSLINLGETYMRQGKFAKGRKIFEKVREMMSGTALVLNLDGRMARLFFEFGYMDDARLTLERMIQDDPENREIVYMRALLAAVEGDTDRARSELDAYLTGFLKESRGDTLDSHARRYVELYRHQVEAALAEKLGDPETAAAEWGRMIELNEDAPAHEINWIRVRLGRSLMQIGNPEAAREQAMLILAVNPNNINALLMLCEADLEVGRAGEARAALDRLQLLLANADVDLPALGEAALLEARLESAG